MVLCPQNFSLDWCKQPDVGLPKPDLVVFLQLQLAEAAARGEFGRERYESGPFQQRALQRFQQLLADPSLPWKVSAAWAKTLHVDIRQLLCGALGFAKHFYTHCLISPSKCPHGNLLCAFHVREQMDITRVSGLLKLTQLGTSLEVQWLRIRLPMQGAWVQSLVREDPTCHRATKPVYHNF